MAQQTIDDRTLIEALFDVFRSRGYEGTTLSLLSEVTGLKKSSLYHRFPAGKDDMVKAVVLHVSAQLKKHIIEPLLHGEVAAEKRFNDMIVAIRAFYEDGRKNCLLNVLSLEGANTEIKALMNKDYRAWLAALIKLGRDIGMSQQEAEARAEHFLIVVEGALVIQRLTRHRQTLQKSLEYEKKHFFT